MDANISNKCQLCGAINLIDSRYCTKCGSKLQKVSEKTRQPDDPGFTIKKTYQNSRQELEYPAIDTSLPWYDRGEDIVVNQVIAPSKLSHPFEIYFYEPVTGYGFMQFQEADLSLKFPRGKTSGYGGSSWGSLDLDLDGDVDADDLGCLLGVGVAFLFSWAIKKN